MSEPPKRQDTTKVSVVSSVGKEAEQSDSFQIPRVAISERKEAVILQLEMPGVGPDNVELGIDKDRLTVIGRRDEPTEGLDPVYRNRNPLSYRRIFSVGRGIDYENIRASLENDGMMTITLPKVTSEIGKSITVRTS